jgi:tetratricopeptide (TPR) repeat protein
MNESFENGVRLYHARRPEQALQEFRGLAEGSGTTPEVDYYIGLCLTQMGRWDEALLALQKVVDSSFSFLHAVQSRMVLGYIYSVTGRHRLAEFEFARVCDLGLQSSQALAALGFALYAQHKVTEALDTLKRALELDPGNANALNSMGFILAEEKLDPSRAVALCRQAVDVAPRNPAYLDSLGWALFQQGGLDEAKGCFRKALDLAPGNKEIAAHMRTVMEKMKGSSPPR